MIYVVVFTCALGLIMCAYVYISFGIKQTKAINKIKEQYKAEDKEWLILKDPFGKCNLIFGLVDIVDPEDSPELLNAKRDLINLNKKSSGNLIFGILLAVGSFICGIFLMLLYAAINYKR
jgi:hypothetical protein